MKKLLLIPLLFLSSTPVDAAYYQKRHVGEDQNSIVKLASEITNNNFDFILTLEAENGLWRSNRRSIRRNPGGSYDWGLCQLNSRYHWRFIRSAEFKNPELQLRYCYEVFLKGLEKVKKGGKMPFYGYYKRLKHINKFFLTQ